MNTHWAPVFLAAVFLGLQTAHADDACQQWHHDWAAFKSAYYDSSGRIIANADAQTHSEAQAYSLFFALVANDRTHFDHLLRWTDIYLAGGRLGQRLPAWLWGKREDGSWGVLDDNSASDADILLAYTLGEASRLWQQPEYGVLARAIARSILRDETRMLPGLGLLVLPGREGFSGPPWKLNPSYYPTFALRRLAALHSSDWKSILQSAYAFLERAAPNGIQPDWIWYDKRGVFEPTKGSYDAIRTYLWAGMDRSTKGADLAARLQPFYLLADRLGHVPESVDPLTLQASGRGSTGFVAAANTGRRRQDRPYDYPSKHSEGYYTQSLSLFGMGFGTTYEIGSTGELIPAWSVPVRCIATTG